MSIDVIDMSDADYFAHPALSHSDAKLLLDSPARFRWVKDHDDRPYRPEFEFGHAVHEMALGKGAGIVVVDAADWRTKAAQAQRDKALGAGKAPMLTTDHTQAEACAAAVRAHPVAKNLLDHLDHVEAVAIWDDGDVQRRAKLDGICGRFAVDLKTTVDASTDAFGLSAARYHYAGQAAWYIDALAAVGIDDPHLLFIAVEKHPPHLVNVIELDPYDVQLGAHRNRTAIDLYRRCRDAGEWPAYGDGINTAQLPRWAEILMETM